MFYRQSVYRVMSLKLVLRNERMINLLQQESKVTLEVARQEICVFKFSCNIADVFAENRIKLNKFLLLEYGVK